MVFPLAFVVVGRPSHLALYDHNQLVANLQLLGSLHQVVDPGQKLRDQSHLVGIVGGVAVELAD